MTIYEDEIDLYPYLLAIRRNWFLIFILAGLLALFVFLFTWLQPRTFEATAMIIAVYERPVLSLSEEFSTINDTRFDSKNKTQAFIAIASSDTSASNVFQNMENQLAEDIDLDDFKKFLEISDQGDLILITASHEDPSLAAAIANTWAKESVKAINSAYSNEQSLVEVENQIAVAYSEYLAAQTAVDDFIRNNKISALERRIAEEKTILARLQSSQIGVIDIHLDTQLDWLEGQAKDYLNALSSQNELVFDQQIKEQAELFSYYYARKFEMEKFLVQAIALKGNLESASSSSPGLAGEALALFLAEAKAFGLGGSLNLETSITEITVLQDDPENYIADIDQLIKQLEAEIQKSEERIQELSVDLLEGGVYQNLGEKLDESHPLYQAGSESLDALLMLELPVSLTPDYVGTPLYEQIEEISLAIQDLRAQLNQEQVRGNTLNVERDLAQKVYEALLERETEVKTASESNREVLLASVAITPTEPIPRGTLMKVAVAGVLGAMIAVVWILVREWWKNTQDSVSRIEE